MMPHILNGWTMQPERVVRGLLEEAGIRIGGDSPQDIHIEHPGFYARAIREGSLGIGESYMDGWWHANALDSFIERIIRSGVEAKVRWNLHTIGAFLMAMLTNRQTRRRSTRVARQHYDLKEILPHPLLDPYNQYTCAYFDDTDDLHVAQEKKLDLICRKLQLQPGDHVLDVGCGWGGFARFAAKHYGCRVTGISISAQQILYAKAFCADLPVDIRYCDYRDLEGQFNKALICGMIEHVGHKNYRGIFQAIHDHLADDGLFLLHTIGGNTSRRTTDAFLDKYIFPGGMIPSVTQIGRAHEGLFALQDVQNLARHYDPTLMAWHDNMQKHWPELSLHYDEQFRRMFQYYLLSSAGAFRAGDLQHWQMVFSKIGTVMDYRGQR